MKAFQRDFFREIGRKQRTVFLRDVYCYAGCSVFSGIRSAKNDMHVSADSYYDRVNFMGIRVVSTLGLTEDDLEDMRNTEGVAAVTGGYTAEVLNEQSDMEFALKVIAWAEEVNQVTLTEKTSGKGK